VNKNNSNASENYDFLSMKERSHRMSLIKSSGTRPEKKIRSALHKLGFRFRIDVKSIYGRPDIVFSKFRTVIFINGCFWHRHNCRNGKRVPKNNEKYWIKKFYNNIKRDELITNKLTSDGWKVIKVWECEIKDISTLANNLAKKIRS
jgi:DNA mismatch endonuclease (patch repair protein)